MLLLDEPTSDLQRYILSGECTNGKTPIPMDQDFLAEKRLRGLNKRFKTLHNPGQTSGILIRSHRRGSCKKCRAAKLAKVMDLM